MVLIPHPPYLSDLASCDYFLFPWMKNKIKRKRFADVDEMKRKRFTDVDEVNEKMLEAITVFPSRSSKNILIGESPR